MVEQNEKYLIHQPTYDKFLEGLDTNFSFLSRLCNVAIVTNRILVIDSAVQNPVHNFGKSYRCPVERYLDLDKTKIYKIEKETILTQKSFPLSWISRQDFFNKVSVRQDQIKKVSLNQVYDSENERYKVLHCNGHPYDLSRLSYYIRFVPSQTVTELTDIVLRRLGTSRATMQAVQDLFDNRCNTAPLFEKIKHQKFFYSCLHVRANDMLLKALHYFHAAQPRHIKRLVYSACPRGTKLYIMSDIHNPNFFDFLRNRYDVYTYHDFPELKQLIDGKDSPADNGMLFMVEKNIMAHALVKIIAPQRSLHHFQLDFTYSIPGFCYRDFAKNAKQME